MASHSRLSLLLVVAFATICIALKDDLPPAAKSNEVVNPDSNIPLADDPRFNKMLPKDTVFDESLSDSKSDPKIPLANDPRFNKMLPKPTSTDSSERVTYLPMANDPRFNKMLPKPTPTDQFEQDPTIPLANDPRFNKMLPKESNSKTMDDTSRGPIYKYEVQDKDDDIEEMLNNVRETLYESPISKEISSFESKLTDKDGDSENVEYQRPPYRRPENQFSDEFKSELDNIFAQDDVSKISEEKIDETNTPNSYEIKRLESENSGNLVVDLTNKTASAEQKFKIILAERYVPVNKLVSSLNDIVSNVQLQSTTDDLDANLNEVIKTVYEEEDSTDSLKTESSTEDFETRLLNAINKVGLDDEKEVTDSVKSVPSRSMTVNKINKLSGSVASPTSKSPQFYKEKNDTAESDSFEANDDYDNYEYDDEYYDSKGSDKPKPIKGNDSDEYEYSDEEKDNKKTSAKPAVEQDIPSSSVPCPRNCKCARNIKNYMVATCNRLDAEVQKFGNSISDLQVEDANPKYPIVLGPEFFKKIGLKNVTSIKITNCTIEYIHPTAFAGLNNLYSVNLTNSGLDMVHPDTFAENTALRLLTLAGNDLRAMQAKNSPFSNYMLKAPFLEELDISRANLKELLPTAFNGLRSIVYINLSDNMLTTLPENLFHKELSIEQLDLSFNSIAELPKRVFNETSISVIDLKYNQISGHLNFLNKDVQNLDLSYNKITHVNDVLFRGLTGLTNLVLKGNMITKIHQSAFVTLKDLHYIDLSFNDMEQVSSLMFNENNKLDVIKMNDNKRLKKLPLNGFESNTGSFDVFHFDLSNCDISELGSDTFSTMPQLTTLKLAWNNIEVLGKGVFRYLGNLVKLDLSNNLMESVNDLLFLHNQKLKKLNLAGNPIEKLSTKVFLPTEQLSELDISSCNLGSIFAESSKTATLKVLKNLQLLNVSNNDITAVMRSDLESMENLSVLDISNNRLHCNSELKSLIEWLNKRNIKVGNSDSELLENAEMNVNAELYGDAKQLTWDDFFRGVCRRDSSMFKPGTQIVDSKNNNHLDEEDQDDDEYDDSSSDDDDDSNVSDIVDQYLASKAGKPTAAKSDNRKKSDEDKSATVNETILGETDSANDDDDDATDDDDDDEEYESYDEEDGYEDEDEDDDNLIITPKLKEKDLIVEEMNIVQGLGNKILEIGEDEEVVIERGHFIIGRQRFWVPIVIVVVSVCVVLLVIGKIVALLMRRRGERYREALLASKNSIVYQKLSEEIGAAPQTPKFHRYAPINQV